LGATRRRLSFFAVVLCHSRMSYVEFTCGEAMEHFLGCHRNALEYFGGAPAAMLIDNLKTGVLSHRFGQPAVFHPRYLDFAAHYGFSPRACNVRKANEKGQVENFVRHVKNNFLAGMEVPPALDALNLAARQWLEGVANVRLHKETRKPPRELFALEAPALRPLPAVPADTSVARLVRVTSHLAALLPRAVPRGRSLPPPTMPAQPPATPPRQQDRRPGRHPRPRGGRPRHPRRRRGPRLLQPVHRKHPPTTPAPSPRRPDPST
jgi:hypothetical protein